MQTVVIIGAGGHAREVVDVIDAINSFKLRYKVIGFIVDPIFMASDEFINDLPILGDFDWLNNMKDKVLLICGVGLPHHRYSLIKRTEKLGYKFVTIIHPNAIVAKRVKVGNGVIITAGSILTNNVHIHDHVHVNLNCTISHDSVLHNFVTLSPGTHVSGNVIIEEGVFVGTGANIIEKKKIGRWSTVGAGGTVIQDVPPNTTVAGVPAKVISRKINNWHSNP